MPGPLEASFRSDVGCDAREAVLLAAEARARVRRLVGDAEDSDEDVVLRLRDPRLFGAFAEPLLRDRRLPRTVRVGLAEYAFDLLPLPRGEGDVILVEARAPPRLLALAAFLVDVDAFSVLHLLHLVYAVFLDRSLIGAVDRRTRSAVLSAVLAHPETGPRLRTLYAGLHLAAVPGAEARAELRRILRSRGIPREVREDVAALAASADGGMGRLVELAREEGLLPSNAPAGDPGALATIHPLPERLASVALRWRKGLHAQARAEGGRP